jgi:hypothetical protein
MTLQASKPITLTDIQAEFSAPLSATLADFVRGGAFVPDTGPNAGVPTSKPILMTDLLGAESSAAFGIAMSAGAIGDVDIQPNPASAGITFSPFGVITFSGNLSSPNRTTEWWSDPVNKSIDALWEVSLFTNTGTNPTFPNIIPAGGTLGLFLGLNTFRTWGLNTSSAQGGTNIWTFRVREVAVPSNFVEGAFDVSISSEP